MQEQINEYFEKICKNEYFKKFFENKEEEIIGTVKEVLEELKRQEKEIGNTRNEYDEFDEEMTKYIIEEIKKLIVEIKEKYKSENDIIKLGISPMDATYFLQDRETLLEELKEYYEELVEEKK